MLLAACNKQQAACWLDATIHAAWVASVASVASIHRNSMLLGLHRLHPLHPFTGMLHSSGCCNNSKKFAEMQRKK
jgi:hypothetical protein